MRRHWNLLPALALAIAGVTAPRPARADHYQFPASRPHGPGSPWHLYLGAGVLGTRLVHGDASSAGGGVALSGGLEFNPRLSLEVGWLRARQDLADAPPAVQQRAPYGGDAAPGSDGRARLRGWTLDVKLRLTETTRGGAGPYLQGGFGLYDVAEIMGSPRDVGVGFQAGVGFDLRIARRVTVGLRALYRGVDAPNPSGDVAAGRWLHATTVDLGLAVHF